MLYLGIIVEYDCLLASSVIYMNILVVRGVPKQHDPRVDECLISYFGTCLRNLCCSSNPSSLSRRAFTQVTHVSSYHTLPFRHPFDEHDTRH
jgi:hypothetical protein